MSISTTPDASADGTLRAEDPTGADAWQLNGLSRAMNPQLEPDPGTVAEPHSELQPEPQRELRTKARPESRSASRQGQGQEQRPVPTVWAHTAAEPATLKPMVPEPRRQRIHFERYEQREQQHVPPVPREQLRLELPGSEPSRPELPQTRPPDSEVMPSSSQDLRVGHRRLLPKWTGWVLLGLGVLTLPWVAGLAVELPSRSEAAHYDVSWAGFDVLLCLLLLRTGWSALHDLEHVEVTAAMTGSLLIVDAWFDVMSAPNTRQFLIALAMAVCVELPLAGFCLWIAGRVEFERRRRSEVLTALVRRFENRRRNRPQQQAPAPAERL